MSRGDQGLATSIAFTCIASIFIFARAFVRLKIIKHSGPEDWLIFCAFACSVALTVMIGMQNQNGLGRHIKTLHDGQLPRMLEQLWASIIAYNLGLILIKISILFQFLRFFVHRGYRIACWILIGLVCSYGVSIFLVSIFSCTPIALYWDKTIQGGHCINLTAFWFSNASFNILTDISVCVLPIPVLKALQLPKKQKYSLVVVFALGGFGCITSVLRLHSLFVISKSTDPTYDNVGAAVWSSVELNVGTMCACLPTLRPLINILFPHLLQTSAQMHRGVARSVGQISYYHETSVVEYGDDVHLPSPNRFSQSYTLVDQEKNSKRTSLRTDKSGAKTWKTPGSTYEARITAGPVRLDELP